MSKKLKIRLLLISVITVLVAAGCLVFLYFHYHNSSPISVSIQKQLSFIPFVTAPTSFDPVGQPYSIKYDKSAQVLSYDIKYAGQQEVVSQQATPQSFNDIPQVYSQLIAKMQGQSSFSTPAGTVNITYPTEYNGTQTAVMNSEGVLMFVRPTKNMSDSQWQKLFDQFTTLHE
jgi:hypothetical protein